MTTELITITEAPHSRRGLLGLMAKALALTTIPATQALASADAQALSEWAATEENPELLALGEQLETASATLRTAAEQYWATVRAGKKMWPRAPLILRENNYGVANSLERDVTGLAFTELDQYDEEAG